MVDTQRADAVLETVKTSLRAGERFLLYLAFVNGKTKPPKYHNGHMRSLAQRGLIELLPTGEYKLTLAGVDTYTQIYLNDVKIGARDEVTTINYFRCHFSERLREGFEGPVIVCSNEGVINYTKMLQITEHLSLSPRTVECDYAVLDFIDEYTGESHDLYPGDTVVMNSDGYVIHKFSE
ncbi:hypothetical protein ST201phi2-1p258 [Pseudomonas phage 201phi2-1]|uniref:Uncharacterized protein n=1 Tax=Pseudomonas phage 201phi2-1 TaxID=198110 RepID=B3FJC0_BP201|nr:hypothetical protein ST201phi2-1p258 [Pseudomonas phage 201phi2-1]ABY63086.1 hypothetical protein 201phi2-1p258 [Pseudomonas phage 201phi2-1]